MGPTPARWMCVALLLALSACGEDGGSGGNTSGISTGPERDGGRVEDPPEVEAPTGADAPDHEVRSEDANTYLCGYDDEDAHDWPGSERFGEVAVGNDGRGFALAHHDPDGALYLEAIEVGRGELAQDSVRLHNPQDDPRDVALAAVSGTFVMLLRSGDTLLLRTLDGDSQPEVLTDALATNRNGRPFALVAQQDHFVAAWIEDDGALPLQRLTGEGALDGSPVTLPTAATPQDLQLGRLDEGKTLLAYFELDGGEGRVMAQVLDGALAAQGDSAQVNQNAVADARFDLGARRLSAGVLFHAQEGGVRDTVKYRRIDPDGQPRQPVLNVVNAPGRARDGSITAFGQGYAVAYRALPSLGVDRPTLRIAFVNQFGRIVHEAELGETSEDGGRTSITATAGAELLVGWTTRWPSGPRTHALQLDCPGALVLCGGSVE